MDKEKEDKKFAEENPVMYKLHEDVKKLCDEAGCALVGFFAEKNDDGAASLLIHGANEYPLILGIYPAAVFRHEGLAFVIEDYLREKAHTALKAVIQAAQKRAAEMEAADKTKH